MSNTEKSFAEQMLDSMVDENGCCGERGLSEKQFAVLNKYLVPLETRDAGVWEGDYGYIQFESTDYDGFIGRYYVRLNLLRHFNDAHSVVCVKPWCDEMPDTSNSQWVGEKGERIDTDVVCVSAHRFDSVPYSYYDNGERTAYTFVDADGNAYTWFTVCAYERQPCSEDDPSAGGTDAKGSIYKNVYVDAGTRLHLRGTVKSHGEYKGTRQTQLTRCKVSHVVPFVV